MGPAGGYENYIPVEVNDGNAAEYPSAGTNYGWYYVLVERHPGAPGTVSFRITVLLTGTGHRET